ncbi:NACHT domain-containing protein [Streptomyces sp. NPDC053048]|uniref:NACHT domain-containing protein n=1 Tax=Streptomyces sp. NPDC053048 TaxID=3365694 RepID=UPI0037D990DE
MGTGEQDCEKHQLEAHEPNFSDSAFTGVRADEDERMGADQETSEALAELAALFRLLRSERRLTYAALERRAGLGHTTVSRVLNGRKVPTEATVVALAKALGADPGHLMSLRDRAVAESAPAPHPLGDEDAAFEERYRGYLVERHSRLTIVGLDLQGPQAACWPLDTAYLSLELAVRQDESPEEDGHGPSSIAERAERALAGRQRVLVRGLAGSGKTTLLQWLAVISAGQQPPGSLAHFRDLIPFVLPLRTLHLHSALPSPAQFLEAVRSTLASCQPLGWADRVLASGRGLLLIDGIDEVPSQRREQTKEWLRDLLAAYPRSHFLVTTRPSAVPERWLEGSRFTELTVRPMNRRDVTVFATRWHEAAGAGPGLEERFKNAVRAQRDLAQLASTPLMCALMCALHRDRRGHLPRSRMELYDAALSMLLFRRDIERGIEAPEGISLTQHQAIQLLQRLAYWLIRNGQTEMEEETALAVIDETLPAMPAVSEQGNAERVLTHLVSRSGLLRRPTADTIDFVHRTFQDYLGAKAAVETRDLGLLVKNAHDDQWEDVLRMAVAHARPAERATLLRRLVARGDRSAKHRMRLHLLAMACLDQATELNPDVREAVESRCAALLPPRSAREAAKLACIGPVILDLLPGPEEVGHEDEAKAVVQTAVTVGGDAAMSLLKKYRDCREFDVQSELAMGWNAYDAQEYDEEILRHLDESAKVVVNSHAELKALPALRQKVRLSFSGDFSTAEIASAVDAGRLRDLGISGGLLTDLGFVRNLRGLRNLSLSFPRGGFDVSPLDELPLTSLVIWSRHALDLSRIRELPHLEHLNLHARLVEPDVTHLPGLPNLRRLFLWERACLPGVLSGVSRFTGLEFLSFIASGLAEAARGEIAAMPSLVGLQIVGQNLSRLAESPPLPHVSDLILNNAVGLSDLTPVVKTFSNLRRLTVACRNTAEAVVDLTSLAGSAEHIEVHIIDAVTVIGLDLFPPGTVIRSPRPRTP